MSNSFLLSILNSAYWSFRRHQPFSAIVNSQVPGTGNVTVQQE